ncbi:MAG TPA: hypothetical protein PKJ45_11095 [Rubrivivax sp.]|nr:hypothetical protein [Rubrivivax sp.]
MPPAQQREDRQGPWRLVRVGALQHQHRAAIGQPTDLLRERPHGRAVHIEGVIGGVAADHRDIDFAGNRFAHGKAKAARRFVEVLGTEMQIGEVSNPEH